MADRTRYVNTDSTAGGNGTTNATSGDNRAYASVNAALAAEVGNLVSAEEQLVVLCDAPSGVADTTKIEVGGAAGWTTSLTYGVVIRANVGNAAGTSWVATKYRLEWSNMNPPVSIASGSGLANLTFENLQLRTIVAGSNMNSWLLVPVEGIYRVDSCFVRLSHQADQSRTSGLVYCSTEDAGAWVKNSFVIGDNVGASTTQVFARTALVSFLSYNNTFVVSRRAFNKDGVGGLNTICKNTIVQASEGYENETFTAESNHNLSSTAAATGGDNDIVSETVTFVGSGDYALSGTDTSGAIGGGTSLAADGSWAFEEDIVGTARPQGTDWDIGAFEFAGTFRPAGQLVTTKYHDIA